MTLGTAALLLAVAVIGIMLTGQYLRERRALRMACGVTHTGKIHKTTLPVDHFWFYVNS